MSEPTPTTEPMDGAPSAQPTTPAANPEPAPADPGNEKSAAPRGPHPLLAVLAQRHPALFGDTPLPLKLGIFDDLLAHGEASGQPWDKPALKAALAQHARSTRYLRALSEGQQRHDLNGQPVDALAPEHRYHALVEYHRRKQTRTPYDLTPQVKRKIVAAQAESGLSPEAYATLVRGKDEAINAVLDDALRGASQRHSRDEALLRAFDGSGMDAAAFADAYGLSVQQVQQVLQRAGRS